MKYELYRKKWKTFRLLKSINKDIMMINEKVINFYLKLNCEIL